MKCILPALFLFSFIVLFPQKIHASQIVINEISPISNPEWVELYNSSAESIDITGWKLVDGANNLKVIASATISAQGFFIFETPTSWLNNSGQESLFFKNMSDEIIDSIVYGSGGVVGIPEVDKSIGRSPDGSTNWTNNLTWSKGSSNYIVTPTPTQIPTATPTATPTTSPTPAKATYKINKPKDQNNQLITGVKIYIDNVYTHHQDEEMLEFCNNCFCDDAKSVSCDFGEHVVKLVKTDYQDWSEMRVFTQGVSYEATPIFTKIPEPTNTPTTSPTPTTVINLISTPTTTTSPTPSLRGILDTAISVTQPAILGESSDSASFSSSFSDTTPGATEESEIKPFKTAPYKTIFFIGLGIALASGSLLYLRFKSS